MRSRGWPSSNLTIVLIIRGKSGHGDIHKETTLLEDESRSRWCTCKPRNTKDCEQTTRGQEKSMEKGLPHSPQREPQEWPWTCTSSYKSGETIYFRCFEHPVFWSFVMAALANEHSTLDLKKKDQTWWRDWAWPPTGFPWVAVSDKSSHMRSPGYLAKPKLLCLGRTEMLALAEVLCQESRGSRLKHQGVPGP